MSDGEKINRDILKATLILLLPAMGILLFVLLIYFYLTTHATQQVLLAREADRIDLQRKYLNADIDSVVTDLQFFAQTPHVQVLIGEDEVKARNEIRAIEEAFLAFARAKELYDQLRILDRSGQEVVRVNYNGGNPVAVSQGQLQNKKDRYYFNDTLALEKGEIFISPFDLNVEEGQIEQPLKPMIRFGIPLIAEKGEKWGILMLNYFGSRLLDHFYSIGSSASSGRNYLLNRDSYYLAAENPDITWGFMYPGQKAFEKTFANDFPNAWTVIRDTEKGQFETDSGLFTFHTVYPMVVGASSSTGSGSARGGSAARLEKGDYFWKLVSFIPHRALYAESIRLKKNLSIFFLMLSTVLGWGAWKLSFARYSRALAEKEVKELQGIIPICMYCKEIRDDKGSWNQIEAYIETHTEAQFSHGVCERCIEEHYGEDIAKQVKEYSLDKRPGDPSDRESRRDD